MEVRKHYRRRLLGGLVLLLMTSISEGQRQPVESRARGLFQDLPGELAHQVEALGDRTRQPRSERIVLGGEFTNSHGQRFTVRVTLQLPELVRIEGFNPGGEALAFDSAIPGRRHSALNEALLETFAMDTPEGMFTSIRRGAAVHVAGFRFGPGTESGYSGPRYDIFDVTSPAHTQVTIADRLKRYFFNSETGLLASTQYTNERQAHIETRFSLWQKVRGSVYPERIERFEDGQPVFAFRFDSFAAEPRQDPAGFPVLEEPVREE